MQIIENLFFVLLRFLFKFQTRFCYEKDNSKTYSF